MAVFTLKMLAFLQLQDNPLIQIDSGLDTSAYAGLAARVLAGDFGLGPGLYYVSPLYIYFLAGCLAAFTSYTAVHVVQIALGTAAVGLTFLTARVWFGGRAAWAAAILSAATGLFTFYEILIIQSSIDAFLTSAALYALTRGLLPPRSGRSRDPVRSAGTRNLVIAGVIFGIQTLNRPNVLGAALIIAVALAIALRRVRRAAWLLAGLVLGLSPVVVRNAIVAHEWTLVSSHGGLNFYIGNNERATGFYASVPGVTPNIAGQERDVRAVASQALGHPATAAEASDYFFALGRRWILAHPAAALALFLEKLGYVFSSAHAPLPHSYPFYAHDLHTVLRFYVIGPWLLVPLGLAGLVLGIRSRRERLFWVWAAFVPAYAISVAAFFVAERYRLPILVPLAVGSGATIDYAIAAIASRNPALLAMPAGLVAVLSVGVNWPLHLDEGRWVEGLRLTQALAIHHRYEEADRWAARLDASNPPQPGAGAYGLGEQLVAINEPDRAVPYLEAAARADPANAKAEYELGQALLKAGRPKDAVPHLRRGFDAGVELPDGGFDLALAYQATGDLPAAVAAIRRVRPDPNDAEAWLRLGRLAAEVHAPDVAEPLFPHAAAVAPDAAAARQQYGLDLLVLGRYEDAARELTAATRLDPSSAASLSHLAYAEARMNQADAARLHAQAALALDPGDELAKQLLLRLR